MHTAATPFTLHAWKEGNRHDYRSGWKGTSHEFGDITLTCPLPRTASATVVSEVRGGLIPTASFEARGIHTDVVRLPTLNRSTLRVGDAMVYMTRNRWGATHQQRSLQLKYAGDRYRMWAVDAREYVVSREADNEDPGVTIRVRESGRGKRKQLAVQVTGQVGEGDISLALIFAGVDRSALTRRGAVRAGFSRVTHLFAESQY
ncbi:hypothetical protein ACIHCQ_11090 [Streptomyces sp. NPDC052236]|uniref:hypothetical protein n=1 Tax=Streptomyces sp. NPDC052236 TaxID=3365686 RepID=UPI0037D97B2E